MNKREQELMMNTATLAVIACALCATIFCIFN